ncbi:hypothetical protein VU04_05420 [Desulfobulbus sp. TB]|nr:hypothetical protein [Desulfobulbus sp. TB]
MAEYRRTTAHDAVTASGSYAYLEAVRCVRDLLCRKGWEKITKNSLEITALPERQVNVIVSSGNKYTGNKRIDPSTKNRKGKQTQKIVRSNMEQLPLFPELNQAVHKSDSNSTWIFLYHVDIKAAEMRMELSLPVEFHKDTKQVNKWEKRIILPSISFDTFDSTPKPATAPEAEIEIAIKRRVNE